MPAEEVLPQARAAALEVRNRLHRLLASHLLEHTLAQPSEMTAAFDRGLQHAGYAAALFSHLACTLCTARYAEAGFTRVVAAIAVHRQHAERMLAQGDSRYEIDMLPLRGFATYRRLGNHRSRLDYGGDADLHLCDVPAFRRFGLCATPWTFQQDDLRHRWTPLARRKLRFLADCWDAYSRCNFTLADAAIGRADFPASGRLCPEPSPCP